MLSTIVISVVLGPARAAAGLRECRDVSLGSFSMV